MWVLPPNSWLGISPKMKNANLWDMGIFHRMVALNVVSLLWTRNVCIKFHAKGVYHSVTCSLLPFCFLKWKPDLSDWQHEQRHSSLKSQALELNFWCKWRQSSAMPFALSVISETPRQFTILSASLSHTVKQLHGIVGNQNNMYILNMKTHSGTT